MKKILFVFVLLFVLVIVGGVVFAMTFDLNQYRPMIEEQASKALDAQVKIKDISLGWNNGIAAQLKDLAVLPKESNEESISLKQADVTVELLPLLQKNVKVASIALIEPKAHLLIDSKGGVKVSGLNLPPENSGAEKPATDSGKQAPPVSFLVSKINIEDAKIRVTSEMPDLKFDTTVNDIDVKLRNVSLTSPIEFDAKMGVFNQKQNIFVEGIIENLTATPQLRDFLLKLSLDEFSMEEISKIVPALKQAKLQGNPEGDLSIAVPKVQLDANAVKSLILNISLEKGLIKTEYISAPLSNINTQIQIANGNLNIDDLSANIDSGKLSLKGAVNNFMGTPENKLDINVTQLNLGKLLPQSASSKVSFEGLLSSSLKAEGTGKTWDQISKSLLGNGSLELTESQISGINVLNKIYEKVTAIPILSQNIDQKIPDSLKEKLAKKNTVLNAVKENFEVKDGQVSFKDMQISTNAFVLRGDGQVGLDGSFKTSPKIRINKEVSNSLIKSVSLMQHLLNTEGEIVIPVSLSGGKGSKFTVSPDMKSITTQITTGQAKNTVGKLVQTAIPTGEGNSAVEKAGSVVGNVLSGTGGATQDVAEQGKALLGSLLGSSKKAS